MPWRRPLGYLAMAGRTGVSGKWPDITADMDVGMKGNGNRSRIVSKPELRIGWGIGPSMTIASPAGMKATRRFYMVSEGAFGVFGPYLTGEVAFRGWHVCLRRNLGGLNKLSPNILVCLGRYDIPNDNSE